MRFSSRPVPSPGRAQNYPPLLMRFFRTNIGSKSRDRSRSSHIFVRRKNTPETETQEPSSPKVTCMGQVRMTRSKKSKGSSRVAGNGRWLRRCGWIKDAFFCHPSAGKLKPNCFSPGWRKWVSFSHVSFARKSEKRWSWTRSEPICRRSMAERDEAESGTEEEAYSSISMASTPPRNALLLTRYRSSLLASRLRTSPFFGDQQEDRNVVWVSDEESKRDKADVNAKPFAFLSRRRLILTRCKSEPARTGERLMSELGFWKNTRLGFT